MFKYSLKVNILLVLLSAIALAQPRTRSESTLCRVAALPSSIQDRLIHDYPKWRIQAPEDLSPRARERWEAEKPSQCPGIASGLFEPTQERLHAVFLVPVNGNDVGYILLVFSGNNANRPNGMKIVDDSKDAKPSNFFIRGVRIGRFFDTASKKKFHVEAQQGILFVDAGESEYESDIYFWSAGKYRHEPVDY
jgi:hypothetical protein